VLGTDRVLSGSGLFINDPSTLIARIQSAFLTKEKERTIPAENL